MAIRTTVDPIDRDVQVIIANDLSPQAKSRVLAQFAREALDDARTINLHALGANTAFETYVDGQVGRPLEEVRPDGTIVFEFDVVLDAILWIRDQLRRYSPVGGPPSPAYKENHALFADGAEVPATGSTIPEAHSYVFINTVPYARKIERGRSPQAPDGVYQVVATLAQKRWRNIAKIQFTYQSVGSGVRMPAIEVIEGK